MVRTRANNAAVRKAVVAKAPRKNISAGRSSVLSPSSNGSGKRKSGGPGHSLKLWPVPKGQKGLQNFFNGNSSAGGSSNEGAGSSSEGAGCSNGPSSVQNKQWEQIEGEQETNSHEEQEDSSQENQEENDSESEEETEATDSLAQLLDGDIAQLNSDDSDED